MSKNTLTLPTLLIIVGLVSACGSGSDANSPVNTQSGEAASPSNDDTLNGSTEETGAQDTVQPSNETPPETNIANPLIDSENATPDSQQEQTNIESDGATEEADSPPPVVNNQRVNFGTAKLLLDLTPGDASYPAKFHRQGEQLYFWTVDTDPRFADCSWHWGRLSETDKSIGFNLVAIHHQTGVVSMNKRMMTLGDFAEDPNNACTGYNGSIMQAYDQTWLTPQSANGEQQFALHYASYALGPDQIWKTDGDASNTSQLATGIIEERTIFEGDKMFFVGEHGISVSDSLSGDRRKLFERNSDSYQGGIHRIARSSARQATFEIQVGENRYQIWTYDLDTDEWVKKFSIKPDDNVYSHYKTLLVDGDTLLSQGRFVNNRPSLVVSRNHGDVTSFQILTDSDFSISNTDLAGAPYSSNQDGINRIFFTTTTDYVPDEPRITTIWRYNEGRMDSLFSIAEPNLREKKIIAGHNGYIYLAGTKDLPDFSTSFELWSYNTQTLQLVKLSNDDWYGLRPNETSPNRGYAFRYLNTPDGLIFVNLTDDSGRELWFTDGTSEGTRQLADINPGSGDSDPINFYYTEDAIYFSADDGIYGQEPWMISTSR